jgi:S1-C subfamily serine protease
MATLALVGCSGRNPSLTSRAEEAAVEVEANGCGQVTKLGGGSFIADDRVVTVAHVVAGSTELVVVSSDGRRHDATVVGIDRRKDLALLAVDENNMAPLPLATMAIGDAGEFVVFREGRPELTHFVTRRRVGIKMDSIDEDGVALRQGYQIEADVVPGDSGAVLVVRGAATAVIFARSRGVDGRAWATDTAEIKPLLDADTGKPVDRGVCSEFA